MRKVSNILSPRIHTNNKKRDAHLLNSDYFDAEKYPEITFKSSKWVKTAENQFDVTGTLSMHGVSKEVTLQTKLLGFGEGRNGAQLSGWEVKTTLNRDLFGISSGKPALGDEVDVEINIEAIKK